MDSSVKPSVDTSVNNDFEKSLVDNGYKFFKDNWKNSIRGFQKRIKDNYGTKYFITGYHYNHKKQSSRLDLEDRDSYSFDVQFRINEKTKDFCIDLRFSADFLPNEWRPTTSLKEVEDFYENAWNNMMADYYEFNYDISEMEQAKILASRRLNKF
jgi:hypothetical protein